jgi:hypothetical protein
VDKYEVKTESDLPVPVSLAPDDPIFRTAKFCYMLGDPGKFLLTGAMLDMVAVVAWRLWYSAGA